MSDLDDEFDREFGSAGQASDGQPADLDSDFDREFGVQSDASPAPQQPAREQGTGQTWMDVLLGFGDGASLGHGNFLGRIGSSMGNAAYSALHDEPGRSVPTMDEVQSAANAGSELSGRAGETLAGKGAKLAGGLTTGIAAGGAAAPTVGAQAATGAALGGAQAQGEHGWDPWSILLGAGTGGALGAAGGALGQGARAAGEFANAAPSAAQQVLPGIGQAAPSRAATVAAKYGAKASQAFDDLEPIKGLYGLAAQGGAKAAGHVGSLDGLLGRTGSALAPAASQFSGIGRAKAEDVAAPEYELGDARIIPQGSQPWLVETGDARIQEPGNRWTVETGDAEVREKAYGTPQTAAWAVQSVLTSGDTGLSPDDEQRLTEAVMSGDEDRVISANFALQMSSPAYARRLQRELESLQER